MSDTPQGDGWWQTSDGLWHPPDYDPTAPGTDPGPGEPHSADSPPPAPPTGPPPGMVPPPWSPTGGSTTPGQAVAGEHDAPTGHQPPDPQGPPPAPPMAAPAEATSAPLFGATAQHGAQDEEEPSPGTLRPGEFGLVSDRPNTSEPRIVSQAPTKRAAAGPGPTGRTVSQRSTSPVIKWSGLAVAILAVLFAGWYFLLRDSGSDEQAETTSEPSVAGETTVSTPRTSPETTVPTTAALPPKPTIAPGARLPVLEFNGSGDATLKLDPPGPRVARVSYSGSGPFKVTGLDANGQDVATYVDTDDTYEGAVAVDFRDEQDSRSLRVEAQGSWNIRMVPVESLEAQPGAFSGTGDDVVLYSGDIGPVTVKYSGSGPFEVNTFEIKTRDIATIVDSKGPYDGSVELRGPAFVWITGDGPWSVTPG